ncbi:MAG: hypothetical protein M9899_02615 [Bdellovibrionaceae bacterium]|nr:hypothetical protein [Pseudobdellovibrionaceae bacterium]
MKVFVHKYSLISKSLLNAQEQKKQGARSISTEQDNVGLACAEVSPQKNVDPALRVETQHEKRNASVHEGLLFQIQFPDQSLGFSSLHVHSSLGDESIETFLHHLKNQGKSYLLKNYSQVILNATVDARDQWRKRLKDPKVYSHYTSVSPILSRQEVQDVKARGFERIKIKIGTTEDSLQNIIRHYESIPEAQSLDWICDFNLSGQIEDLKKANVSKWSSNVYFEDPTSYDSVVWKNLIDLGFKLISDQVEPQQIINDGVRVSAIAAKPNKVDMLHLLENSEDCKIMVTSNMGEDLDILTSWYWAQYVQKEMPHKFFGAGFLTQDMYLPNKYIEISKQLFADQPFISDAKLDVSTGWGRASFLKDLQWVEV